ncbi:zinc finger SWIM domain-containing protein 7 isoform X1 [Ascaphus truei]|uniref:zinc finger SWIM domain-containing protein 7 isoform X1 n=1 Tax=Ascaphus truei TaxID=8439 RepID=UPI003F5A855B
MGAVLPAVAEELLREVKRTYEDTSQVSDELLLGLKFIFGPTALQALDLVDQRSVTQVTSPSGRTTFQVTGSSGKLYTCYSSCHYCSCPAFSFSVLRKNENMLTSFQTSFQSEPLGSSYIMHLQDSGEQEGRRRVASMHRA